MEAKSNAACSAARKSARPTSPSRWRSRSLPSGFNVYFTTLDDMVRQLKAADAIGRLIASSASISRPWLVLDEVGYLPLYGKPWSSGDGLKRYEKGSILLTSNKAFSRSGERRVRR